MSIERMRRVWFLAPLPPAGAGGGGAGRERGRGVSAEAGAGDGLGPVMQTLSELRLVHVEGLPEPESDEQPLVRPDTVDTAEIEACIGRLRQVLAIFDTHAPVKRGFAANFVTLPLEVTQPEYDRALTETDVEALHGQAVALAERQAFLSRRHDEIVRELEALVKWAGVSVGSAPDLTYCGAWLGTMSGRAWQGLEADPEVRDLAVVARLAVAQGRALVAAVALKEDAEAAADRLRRAGFEPLELPPDAASVDQHIAALEREEALAADRLAAAQKDLADLAGQHRAAVTVCLAHWEMAHQTITSIRGTLRTRRIGVVAGYVRAADVPMLRRALAERQPTVGLIERAPRPDEQVPVSLKTRPFFAPARFLTNLFGVPDYFGFDPSPYIFLTFLLFFGFCFGDVVYGLVIGLLGLWIARRVRGYPNLRDFFRLIAWGGVASILVGAVTGAWMADLFNPAAGFVSAGSLFARIRAGLMVEALDPLSQPVRVLLVALAIGMANQFYGIVLRMYREARRGDYVAAVFDGGLWLLFLPGLILLIAAGFTPMPGWVSRVGLILLGCGAAGLVLTQGRREKGLLAKALTGLISLYGILGTYGTTSFIGDTLSYSRLLALGLTTTIVGMSFNIVAGLVRGVPVAGILLVMVVLLIGHTFNILVSILGAFVHSGRLVFVEFFGRFYEVGGKRFQALGTSDRVRVVGA